MRIFDLLKNIKPSSASPPDPIVSSDWERPSRTPIPLTPRFIRALAFWPASWHQKWYNIKLSFSVVVRSAPIIYVRKPGDSKNGIIFFRYFFKVHVFWSFKKNEIENNPRKTRNRIKLQSISHFQSPI